MDENLRQTEEQAAPPADAASDTCVPGSGGSGSALFVKLPADISERVDRFRSAHDPHWRLIPPHVTIIYPPFIPLARWPELRPAVAKCVAAQPAFDVTLQECGAFHGEQHVLWLRPEDGGALTRLNAALTERFPDHVPQLPYSYVPHVTIGFFDSDDALIQAQQEVCETTGVLRFRVKSLTYAAHDHDGRWRLYDELPLGLPQEETITESPARVAAGGAAQPSPGQAAGASLLPLLLIAAVMVVALLVGLGPIAGVFAAREQLLAQVRGAGAWGPLVLIGLVIAQTIAAPIPGQALNFVGGLLFGFWQGTLYSWLGSTLGSALAMTLARLAGRPLAARLVDAARLDRLDRFVAGRGLLFFLVVFLIPGLPDDLMCFAAGLTSLPLPALIAASALGRVPGIAAAVWAGAYAEQMPWQAWLASGGAVLGIVVLWRRYGRRLQDRMLRLAGRC